MCRARATERKKEKLLAERHTTGAHSQHTHTAIHNRLSTDNGLVQFAFVYTLCSLYVCTCAVGCVVVAPCIHICALMAMGAHDRFNSHESFSPVLPHYYKNIFDATTALNTQRNNSGICLHFIFAALSRYTHTRMLQFVNSTDSYRVN